jgi:hypothetical protein
MYLDKEFREQVTQARKEPKTHGVRWSRFVIPVAEEAEIEVNLMRFCLKKKKNYLLGVRGSCL